MQISSGSIYDTTPGTSKAIGERIILLMLPGAKNTPQQLVDYGFIRSLRERGLAVDVLVLDAHLDLYYDRADIERLLFQTLDEVRAAGYKRIWLLGVSLGGMGAMLCATKRTPYIEGVILLAPYLGSRGIIAEIQAAGGLNQWKAGEIGSLDYERALLEKISLSPPDTGGLPPIFLGYGSEDRYRGSSIMLSKYLPEQNMSVIPGGHDWEIWVVLWNMLLDKGLLR